jgi:nucleotide-binding universal stress UspA family protein
MKIIVPSAGPVPDQRTVDYTINIAKRISAQLVVLRVLAENETEAAGEHSLELFVEIARREKVPVNTILRRGDIASAILAVAIEKSVDLIIMGVSHGEVVAEWMNAKARERTDIPVLLIPKWVPAAKRSSSNGCTPAGS